MEVFKVNSHPPGLYFQTEFTHDIPAYKNSFVFEIVALSRDHIKGKLVVTVTPIPTQRKLSIGCRIPDCDQSGETIINESSDISWQTLHTRDRISVTINNSEELASFTQGHCYLSDFPDFSKAKEFYFLTPDSNATEFRIFERNDARLQRSEYNFHLYYTVLYNRQHVITFTLLNWFKIICLIKTNYVRD